MVRDTFVYRSLVTSQLYLFSPLCLLLCKSHPPRQMGGQGAHDARTIIFSLFIIKIKRRALFENKEKVPERKFSAFFCAVLRVFFAKIY